MEKRQLFNWSWNYKRNCLNKNIKKENVLKDLLNLVETNRQINMTSDYSASSNNSFKSHFNAKNFNMFFNIMAVVQSTVILLQCLLQGWSKTYKCNATSTSEENWEEPSSSTISTEASFNDDSNENTLNANKFCWQ